jgi:hypothetical protein
VIPAVTEGRYHEPGERAVVPLGDDKARFLRDAIDRGVVDVALHGWNHRTRAQRHPHSEFAGLSVAEQRERIRRGRTLLHETLGVDTDTGVFVPPWNSYNDATLIALEQEGLTCISANRFGPVRNGRMVYAPITTDIAGIEEAVERARRSPDPDPIIGVLFHHYDFVESGESRAFVSCEQLGEKLSWLKQQPDVCVKSIGALAAERGQALQHDRYRVNQTVAFESISPPFVDTVGSVPVFASQGAARRSRLFKTASIVLTYAVAALLGVGLQQFIHIDAPSYIEALLASALTLLIGRSLVQRQIYFRTMFTIVVLTGMIAGRLL